MGGEEGGKSGERSRRGESQESYRKCPFPGDPRLHPALVGLGPQVPSPRRGSCALGRATCLPRPLRRRREPRGKAAQHPAPAGRSRGDRAVSAVSLREGGLRGERDLETEQGGKTWRRVLLRGPEFRRGAGRMKDREGAPTWQATCPWAGRGSRAPARPARAHLVTVRRARGLCALSRPRRAPMPASTNRAATPHTA